MTYEMREMARRHTPGLKTWLLWTLLSGAGGIVGNSLFLFNVNANPWLNDLFVWGFLAFPLLFVSLGQWLVLRRLVTWAGLWLLTGLLGYLFLLPYLYFYGFADEYSSGQSLVFGTQVFWGVSLTLVLLSLVFGGIIGLVQGLMVIWRYGRVPLRLLWWILGSALAWGTGYPFGQQFVASIFRSFPPITFLGVEGVSWAVIGAITGAVLIWLGRERPMVYSL